MTSTPVGMRCPECSRDRTRVTTGTSAFGRSAAAPATYALIAINVVAFLIEVAAGVGGLDGGGPVIDDFGLRGSQVADGEWYRIITSGFLHAGPIHLLFNMFALYVLGTVLEPTLGTLRFLALYVASLFAGALGVILLAGSSELTVGASGAIFGLFAAAFVIARGRGLQEMASQLGFLLVINLVFTFSIPGISIGGHLGGAIGGALCAVAILAGDRERLGPNRRAAELAMMVILALACAGAAVALA
jgi:membrane associated rhomboid family serine protease